MVSALRRKARCVADCKSRACAGLQIEEAAIKLLQSIAWVVAAGLSAMRCRAIEALVEEGIRASELLRAVREEGEVEEGVDATFIMRIRKLYRMMKLSAERKFARVGVAVEEMEGMEAD